MLVFYSFMFIINFIILPLWQAAVLRWHHHYPAPFLLLDPLSAAPYGATATSVDWLFL